MDINYPSKVTVVCDTQSAVVYKMNRSCLRFLVGDLKLRVLDYFKSQNFYDDYNISKIDEFNRLWTEFKRNYYDENLQ